MTDVSIDVNQLIEGIKAIMFLAGIIAGVGTGLSILIPLSWRR